MIDIETGNTNSALSLQVGQLKALEKERFCTYSTLSNEHMLSPLLWSPPGKTYCPVESVS